ncbi:MAG: TetR/AcrR family transcriptional regulator [Acidimicrobiales bacterium]
MRRALLAAADDLLAEGGPDALTVRAIAERAGTSTMGVYTHFGGKDGVVDALFVEGFHRLSAAMRRVRRTADPLADLRRCAHAYRRNALDNPTHYAVMFERPVPGHEPSDEAKTAALESLGLLEARIQQGVDAGVVDPGTEGAAGLALSVWAALHGMVSLELHDAGPDLDRDRCYDALVDLVEAGLRHSR